MERALTYTARNLRPASKWFSSTEICLSLDKYIHCSFSFLHSCTILWYIYMYIMCYRKSIIVNQSYLVVHCPLAIQETRQPVAPYPPQRRRYLKQRRRWCCVARPSRLIGWSSWLFRPPSLREFQWFLHVLLLVQKVCNANIKHMFLKVAPRFLWQHVFSGMLLSYIHQELLCHCGRPLVSIRHIRPWWMGWLSAFFLNKTDPIQIDPNFVKHMIRHMTLRISTDMSYLQGNRSPTKSQELIRKGRWVK